MSSRVSPTEKLARRRERLRLIAFLKRGGRLVKEELPAGAVAWCPASRSGPAFHERAVKNLRRRGATVRKEKWLVHEDVENGHLYMSKVDDDQVHAGGGPVREGAGPGELPHAGQNESVREES